MIYIATRVHIIIHIVDVPEIQAVGELWPYNVNNNKIIQPILIVDNNNNNNDNIFF